MEALAVREILRLPELAPLQEAPPCLAGVLNLRGQIVPVVDLDVRFGRPPQRRRLEDSIIVLGWEAPLAAILVNEVRTVRAFEAQDVVPPPAFDSRAETRAGLIAALARADEDVIMLLDLERLLDLSRVDVEAAPLPALPPGGDSSGEIPQERALFRERARTLARPIEVEDRTGLTPLAVVGLGGEHFGIELEIVREFAPLAGVTPVPCCPPHILGQMNLRGEILTLVDIRSTVRLPAGGADGLRQVVVAQAGEIRVGVPVHEVLDVVYLRQDRITAVPAALRANEEVLKGAAPYREGLLGILDLHRVLTDGALVVNEEP